MQQILPKLVLLSALQHHPGLLKSASARWRSTKGAPSTIKLEAREDKAAVTAEFIRTLEGSPLIDLHLALPDGARPDAAAVLEAALAWAESDATLDLPAIQMWSQYWVPFGLLLS